MELAEEDLDAAIASGDRTAEAAATEEFNRLRALAETARRNLMIHRQACGFKTDNFRSVLELYPIGPERVVGQPKREHEPVKQLIDRAKSADWLSWRHRKMSSEEQKKYYSLSSKLEKRHFLESLLDIEASGEEELAQKK